MLPTEITIGYLVYGRSLTVLVRRSFEALYKQAKIRACSMSTKVDPFHSNMYLCVLIIDRICKGPRRGTFRSKVVNRTQSYRVFTTTGYRYILLPKSSTYLHLGQFCTSMTTPRLAISTRTTAYQLDNGQISCSWLC